MRLRSFGYMDMCGNTGMNYVDKDTQQTGGGGSSLPIPVELFGKDKQVHELTNRNSDKQYHHQVSQRVHFDSVNVCTISSGFINRISVRYSQINIVKQTVYLNKTYN